MMPRNSLCIHSTSVADGTHQTSALSSVPYKDLSHCGTKACMLVQTKLVSNVCSQGVMVCYTATICTFYWHHM